MYLDYKIIGSTNIPIPSRPEEIRKTTYFSLWNVQWFISNIQKLSVLQETKSINFASSTSRILYVI
jgi:hypothetical protein